MDSVREEDVGLEQIVDRALETILAAGVSLGEAQSEYDADADEHNKMSVTAAASQANCDLDKARAAIMSALKRVPGVGVKELEWRTYRDEFANSVDHYGRTALGVSYVASRERGQRLYSTTRPGGERGCEQFGPYHPTLEAAKAACQADFAERITSALVYTESPSELTQAGERQPEATQAAVEPSCVTDEMVEAAQSLLDACINEYGDPDVFQNDDGPVEFPTSEITFKHIRDLRHALLELGKTRLQIMRGNDWSEYDRQALREMFEARPSAWKFTVRSTPKDKTDE